MSREMVSAEKHLAHERLRELLEYGQAIALEILRDSHYSGGQVTYWNGEPWQDRSSRLALFAVGNLERLKEFTERAAAPEPRCVVCWRPLSDHQTATHVFASWTPTAEKTARHDAWCGVVIGDAPCSCGASEKTPVTLRQGIDAIREITKDMDPTPWCHQCGALVEGACKCGPIADNS